MNWLPYKNKLDTSVLEYLRLQQTPFTGVMNEEEMSKKYGICKI